MPYSSLWAQIPFVGRTEQLQRLAEHRARLEGNRDRVRHMVLIDGFEGVGKTALGEEFLSRVGRDESVAVARGTYAPYLRRAPLAPLLDALDDLATNGFLRRRLLPLFTDPVYRPLIAGLPVVASIIGAEPSAGAEADAGTLASLAASLLVHISRFRPIVLFLDDIHYMSEEDREALLALNAGLRRSPVLVVMTLRTDLPESRALGSMLEPMLAEKIYLPPLSEDEVTEMITRVCGAKVSALLAPEVARLSSGSPQRTLEILRLLREKDVLVGNGTGEWRPGPKFGGRLGIGGENPSDRLERLEEGPRTLLLLLDFAGGVARREELAAWYEALGRGSAAEVTRQLEALEVEGIIKAVYARPDEVTFAHERYREEHRRGITSGDIDAVAAMIVAYPGICDPVDRWCTEQQLLRSILRQLPPPGSDARERLLSPLITLGTLHSMHQDGDESRDLYLVMREEREHLEPGEYARVLVQIASVDYGITRFADAVSTAEELYELAKDPAVGADMKPVAAVTLATARFYNDRTSDVSDLIQEAEGMLSRMANAAHRNYCEINIARLHAMQVPAGKPQEAVQRARRVYFLLDQLGLEEEKYEMLSFIVVHTARARDEEQLRFFCTVLSKDLHRETRKRMPFATVFQAIRASILIGDIFQARELFESWSSRSAPVGVHDFLLHCHLTSLFALIDAEPSLAADMALSGREEFIRYRATSTKTLWSLVYAYVALQAGLFTSLLAAGRYGEALAITEEMEKELLDTHSQIPGAMQFLQLVRSWLVWRCMLPSDAPTSLSWSPHRSTDTTRSHIRKALHSREVIEAAREFRLVHEATTGSPLPQARFHAEMLLAQMETLEESYELALASITRATMACAQTYSWSFELESSAAAITLKLRHAAAGSVDAPVLLQKAVEEARDLFAHMTEKGLAARISQLSSMFVAEAMELGAGGRDIVSQLERLGSSSRSAAHLVLRNSRSKGQGPIEHARLFLLGPLRLMRPYSYMELSETAFERETARTLLMALVAAAVTRQRLTREELAIRISPKSKTPEQQKKALYNAVSAARAACGSQNSILAVGSNSLELNVDLDLEGGIWVDVIALTGFVKRGEDLEAAGSITQAFEAYQQAMLLASKGDVASDCYAEWIDAARDHLREIVRGAALATGRLALRNGMYGAGIEAISAQLTRDPFDEESHRMLIELYREGGNRTAALKQYEKCRAVLMQEFGVEPEPETLLLRRQLVGAA